MRLLIVSNRLPVTLKEQDGKTVLEKSPGGLVSGLTTYLDSLRGTGTDISYRWIGWPGAALSPDSPAFEPAYIPVPLNVEEVENFYHGFCNNTLWPLFHSFPSEAQYSSDQWNTYRKINELFCEAVVQEAQPDDLIWIHDYQLMLLPALLRAKLPTARIGFFLHIPFPHFELFRLLPRKWREQLLVGLLGSQVIGFHTHDYAHYFLQCVTRILGLEHSFGELKMEHHSAKVDTFPMGIDFKRFFTAGETKAVQGKVAGLVAGNADKKTIVSVDRLDYTKGIINRLLAYEHFLAAHPEWQHKVVLHLVVVPSRTGVAAYAAMKRQIDELVGKINGEFGRADLVPIVYQYRSLDFTSLVALYTASDVALVTPLRDGMNLVAKEYVASRADETGVLILSEMAGAAQELGEAVLVNPNHIAEMSEALFEAVQMDVDEQKRRNRVMQGRLARYDIVRWATDFIQSLNAQPTLAETEKLIILNSRARGTIAKDFKQASAPLFLFDIDGLLFTRSRRFAQNTSVHELLEGLERLAGRCSVVLLSGQDRGAVEKMFAATGATLVAEHGLAICLPLGAWEQTATLDNSWKQQVLPVVRLNADRLPGTKIEEREYSIAWHYQGADPELGTRRAKELADTLRQLLANHTAEVHQANRAVEIRHTGIHKGNAVRQVLDKQLSDTVIAIGDATSGTSFFEALPGNAHSIMIGLEKSPARYNAASYDQVLDLCGELLE